MMKARYLTKSRFRLGLECPTKLYYTKNTEYHDNQESDPFMHATNWVQLLRFFHKLHFI